MKNLMIAVILVAGSVAFADRDCRLQGAYECVGNGSSFFLDFSAPSHHITKLDVVETGACRLNASLDGLNDMSPATCAVTGNQEIDYHGTCDIRNVNLAYSELQPNGLTRTRTLAIQPQTPDNSNGISPHPVLAVTGYDYFSDNTSTDTFTFTCYYRCKIPSSTVITDRIFANGFENPADDSGTCQGGN